MSDLQTALLGALVAVFIWAATRDERPLTTSEWLERMRKRNLGTK